MKIVRIEPTPSPNVMKLTMDQALNPGVRINVPKSEAMQAPQYIRRLLEIADVTGVFQTADFIALERHPKGDWQQILQAVQGVLDVADDLQKSAVPSCTILSEQGFGEVTVRVQTFRGIPMQVRVSAGLDEKRDKLSERFVAAAIKAGLQSPNLIMERKLEDRGVRYGALDEVLATVISEIEAMYDEASLDRLTGELEVETEEENQKMEESIWEKAEWQSRYADLQRIKPVFESIPVFIRALKDEHVSIRRYGVVQLGLIEEDEVMPYILEALLDPSPIVRRTAGDVCSDKGNPIAISAMVNLLNDRNKLVRWRAARFLYELGGESELEALFEAAEDAEFEIRLQIKLAIERIQNGEAAQGTVWQQMMNRNLSKDIH